MADKIINVDIKTNTSGVKSLKAELRETIQLLQQTTDPKQFEQLSLKAAELKDKMAEVNEQVNALASGSKYEKVSLAFGEMGAGLRDMDFDRVVSGSKLFAKSAGAITFKDAIGSVKQMGTALMTVGKAILTNPLFLIAGVVTLIVVGIVKLMDKLGILKKIFEFVGGAIDMVVQSIKDFLDWIGLTSFAAEDAAAKQAEAQDKIAKSHEDKRAKVTDAYDHEIELAKIAGESTVEMERQKQYAIIETSREEIAALRLKMESLKIAGTLTKEKSDEIRAAITELKTGIREASQEIQVINATDVADNKAANQKKAEDNKAAAEKRAAARKQEKADRLAATKAIQDAEFELLAEGQFKEQEANRIKYERLIADTLANEKLLADERDKLVFTLKQQKLQKELAIDKQYNDEKLAADKEAAEEKRLFLEEAAAKLNEDKKTASEESLKIAQDFAAAEVASREQLQDALIGIADGTVALLNTVAGKNKAVALTALALEKGAAIASIIINAGKEMSANAVTASANPLNAVTGGTAGAIQLAKANLFTKIRAGLAIATIASTGLSSAKSITSGGTGGAAGGGGGGSASNQTQSNAQPSVNLFGQANQGNNASSTNSGIMNNLTVTAVVSESEVTGTQKKVSKMALAGVL